MAIHPSACVDASSEIDETAEIGPNAYVGPGCRIGANVRIGFGAVVERFTEIGNGSVLSPNAHVGGDPQDTSYRGEETRLKIGENCVIREFAPIHRATVKEDWVTEIGNNCMIMALAHVAHDCKIRDGVIIVGGALLGGHTVVEEDAFIGAMTAVHQFCRIGTQAITGACSQISLDIPPYCMCGRVQGGNIEGLNLVGLKRRGVKPEVRAELKKAVAIFLDRSVLLKDAKEKLKTLTQYPEIVRFREFLDGTKRGVIRR